MTGVVEELIMALKELIGDDKPTPHDEWGMGYFIPERDASGFDAMANARRALSRFNAERGRQPDDAMVERVDRVLRERAYALNRPRAWRLEVVREALIAAINPELKDE